MIGNNQSSTQYRPSPKYRTGASDLAVDRDPDGPPDIQLSLGCTRSPKSWFRRLTDELAFRPRSRSHLRAAPAGTKR
jgi:hypothetical protein